MRIKEGDEWKAVFTTPEGSFEPTVMFFGLTNSPPTFQAIMNKLLRDLINTGKVVVFIDDVIVGMEDKEGHNELVVEIVKRLEENNLYVKPEKCKWKVREVGFLGVMICQERKKWTSTFLIFIFFSIYFLYSIFRTRIRVRVTRSHCHTAGHIR